MRCLASAADYFTTESVEYRLLQRGVAVHHGKMPGLLARRLKVLIDRGFVRVILATSTLSEGVNIPVSYLLIPSVYRSQRVLSLQEFTNLIGRAGRPGVATEGHALVVLPDFQGRRARRGRQRQGYGNLVSSLERATRRVAGPEADNASSALSHLLIAIERAWRELTGGGTERQFADWLEQTAVAGGPDEAPPAIQYLDSLDSFLLAAIQEVEKLQAQDFTGAALEEQLTRIWRRSYAFASARDEERLRGIWLGRGRSLKQRYPDAALRRQIYKTSLAPRSALTLVARAEGIKARLLDGASYAAMTTDERLAFIGDVLRLISEVPSFRIATRLGRQREFRDWPNLLRWWLAKSTMERQPRPRDITNWYDFVSQNFIYRGTWGLGSVLGLLLDLGDGNEPIRALEIDDWPRSGLPWIAFWLKELITWGTLEPVAAFLLARGDAIDRPQAERDAAGYYEQLPDDMEPNDTLDPRSIRDWVNLRVGVGQRPTPPPNLNISATLAREAAAYVTPTLSVMQFEIDGALNWINPSGYVVARSARPRDWPANPAAYDFTLEVANSLVRGVPYLPHA